MASFISSFVGNEVAANANLGPDDTTIGGAASYWWGSLLGSLRSVVLPLFTMHSLKWIGVHHHPRCSLTTLSNHGPGIPKNQWGCFSFTNRLWEHPSHFSHVLLLWRISTISWQQIWRKGLILSCEVSQGVRVRLCLTAQLHICLFLCLTWVIYSYTVVSDHTQNHIMIDIFIGSSVFFCSYHRPLCSLFPRCCKAIPHVWFALWHLLLNTILLPTL